MFLSLSLLIFYLNNHPWFNVNVSLHSRVWINASLYSLFKLFKFFFFSLLLFCPSPCCSFTNFSILEGSTTTNGNVRLPLKGSENYYAWVEFTLFLVFFIFLEYYFENLWNTLLHWNVAHKKLSFFTPNLLGPFFQVDVLCLWAKQWHIYSASITYKGRKIVP